MLGSPPNIFTTCVAYSKPFLRRSACSPVKVSSDSGAAMAVSMAACRASLEGARAEAADCTSGVKAEALLRVLI